MLSLCHNKHSVKRYLYLIHWFINVICLSFLTSRSTSVQISSGPCEADKIFVDSDGINGICHCRSRNHLLFKGDDKCHRIYTKVNIGLPTVPICKSCAIEVNHMVVIIL